MDKKINNCRDLDIWKKDIEIVKDIYRTVRRFPKLELYSLINQIQRASLFIPTNIAEGFK
jgi:four helix bundle protein